MYLCYYVLVVIEVLILKNNSFDDHQISFNIFSTLGDRVYVICYVSTM